MAHEVVWAANVNGYLRQLRSFMMNAPRVVRGNDHDDINNVGTSYTLSGGGARPAGDILHIAPEIDAVFGTSWRLTCRVAGNTGGYGTQETGITVDFATAGRTIINTDTINFNTNFTVGDLVRVTGATTAGNNIIGRILSITTTSTTGDTITLRTEDTLAASDTAEVVDLDPIGGGAIFEITEDFGAGANFLGWVSSDVEHMTIDATCLFFMRNGGVWAVGDHADFDLEEGAFTLHDENKRKRTVTFNDNGGSPDTITRTDYNGNFIRDGFQNGDIVDVVGTVSNDGEYVITAAVTVKTITVATASFTAEADIECDLTPKFTDSVTFATPANTVVRGSGSWIDDGYLAGGQIAILNAFDAGNNDTFLVDTVTALTLTLDAGETIAAEAGDTITHVPRNALLQVWTEHRYRWSLTSGTTGAAANSLDNGEQPPRPDSDDNYTSEWVAIGPGDDAVNNPQTIYCGWQSQFSGASIQNVEMRCFDAVSDSAFNSLANASPAVYVYLTLSPSMELFMTGDGAHVTGFLDVNTSVGEWFYQGFANIHGSQNQHPRPMVNGGASFDSTASRTSTGNKFHFFPSGVARTDGGIIALDPPNCSCWHRWVDGQWFPVSNIHLNSSDVIGGNSATNVNMMMFPYYPETSVVTFPFDGGAQNFSGSSGTGAGPPNSKGVFFQGLRSTPTTITPNPNREYSLLPCVGIMRNPDLNIVFDLRDVFAIPGDGQATKNRIVQGGFAYVVGQNHEKTSQQDFAALRLN